MNPSVTPWKYLEMSIKTTKLRPAETLDNPRTNIRKLESHLGINQIPSFVLI